MSNKSPSKGDLLKGSSREGPISLLAGGLADYDMTKS